LVGPAVSRGARLILLASLVAGCAHPCRREEALTARQTSNLSALEKLARSGDRCAAHDLAMMYEEGKGAPKDCREALKWYEKAGRLGASAGYFNAGRIHQLGLCGPANAAKAQSFYEHAAALGDTTAMVTLGAFAESAGRDAEARRRFEQALAAGEPRARAVVAAYSAQGYGGEKDVERAYDLARESALREGDATAFQLLGSMFFEGDPAPRDFLQAHRFLTLSQRAGNGIAVQQLESLSLMMTDADIVRARALADERPLVIPERPRPAAFEPPAEPEDGEKLWELGGRYYRGAGVPRDYRKAAALFRKSAAKKFKTAHCALAELYQEGAGVPRDYAEAFRWYERGAALGSCESEVQLGNMIRDGQGVPKDGKKAADWFQRGADHGCEMGLQNLGALYSDGAVLPADKAKAIELWTRAADKGGNLAMSSLGQLYENDKDYASAYEWYVKASSAGEVQADYKIGEMLYFAHGIPHDYALAMTHFRRASARGLAVGMQMVATLYDEGKGVRTDPVEAYAWYIRSGSRGITTAYMDMKRLRATMKSAQIDRAAARARQLETAAPPL
jgi:TPR repeat protein